MLAWFCALGLAGIPVVAQSVGPITRTTRAVKAKSTADRDDARAVPYVVVELFTSEGCSSCPPADALLARLDEMQPIAAARIIALEEHVDYWNRLGWKDPFSGSEFSARQNEYAQRNGRATVYTPQMIVDGDAELVGGSEAEARAAIVQAARRVKVPVQLELAEGAQPGFGKVELNIRFGALPEANGNESANVVLLVSEDNLASDIERGENAGLHEQHRAVVRELRSIARVDAGEAFKAQVGLPLRKEWKKEDLRIVVLVQGQRDGRILGASSLQVAGHESRR